MNTISLTQAVIEDVANVQKHFIDGIVASTKTFTATSDRTPLLKGLDATQGLLVTGIKARAELLDVLYTNVAKIEQLPAPVAKVNAQVKELAEKFHNAEQKIVKNAFESLERFIPAAADSKFVSAFQTPMQTVLDLTKKAFEVPANFVKKFATKAEAKTEQAVATATAATEKATEKVEEVAKEVAAKVEKKAEKVAAK